jgi:hypothetical protein
MLSAALWVVWRRNILASEASLRKDVSIPSAPHSLLGKTYSARGATRVSLSTALLVLGLSTDRTAARARTTRARSRRSWDCCPDGATTNRASLGATSTASRTSSLGGSTGNNRRSWVDVAAHLCVDVDLNTGIGGLERSRKAHACWDAAGTASHCDIT